MYLKFYNFKHKPFQINTDPRFLWMGEKHKEAFSTLRYGLHDNIGLLLLTGDVGTGKTTLINGLLGTLNRDNTHISFIRDPGFTQLEFFQYTAHSFGLDPSIITNKTAFLIHFEKFLFQAYEKRQRVLLIIDEVQRISQELLEEIRLLSNLEKDDNKLLNIFFVGQTEFNDMLLRSENRAIRQRISVHYNLEVLDREETIKYVQHRLRVSSSEESFGFFSPKGKNGNGAFGLSPRGLKLPELREEIFTMDAIRAVYTYSKGYPRIINTLCDKALLTGFLEETKPITRAHVEECAKELEFPGDENRTHHPSAAKPDDEKKQQQYNATQAAVVPNSSRHTTEPKDPIAADSNDKKIPGVPIEPETSSEPVAAESSATKGRGRVAADTGLQELLQKVEELEQIARKWEQNETKTKNQAMDAEPLETGSRPLVSIKKLILPLAVIALVVLVIYGVYADEPFSFLQKYQVAKYLSVTAQPPPPPVQREAGPYGKEAIEDTPAASLHSAVDESAAMLEKTIRFPGDAIFPPDDALAVLKELHRQAAESAALKVMVVYPFGRVFTGSRNPTLAISRANTVKSYLIGRGLEPSRILVLAENDPSLSGNYGSTRLRSPLQNDHILISLAE